MGIAVTKQGNMYNKTHSGTVVGGAAGAMAGASVAAVNAEKIESGCRVLLDDMKKELREIANERRWEILDDTFDKAGKVLDGTFDGTRPRASAETEIAHRFQKKLVKCVDYFRMNPVKCLSIAGGVAGAVVIGSVINGAINRCRAHNADKQNQSTIDKTNK